MGRMSRYAREINYFENGEHGIERNGGSYCRDERGELVDFLNERRRGLLPEPARRDAGAAPFLRNVDDGLGVVLNLLLEQIQLALNLAALLVQLLLPTRIVGTKDRAIEAVDLRLQTVEVGVVV